MKKPAILFIQGGGAGAYAADKPLADYLQNALGKTYEIIYPKMPHEHDPDYALWKMTFDQEIEKIAGQLLLVGHSVGGYLLLRYLSETRLEKALAGLFFIAIPFLGDGGWHYEGVTVAQDLASKLPPAPLFFYHSTDDPVVPFSHLALYADKLPHATIRKLVGRGHQLNNDLTEVVQDMQSLR